VTATVFCSFSICSAVRVNGFGSFIVQTKGERHRGGWGRRRSAALPPIPYPGGNRPEG
jgi:hypothetical protein